MRPISKFPCRPDLGRALLPFPSPYRVLRQIAGLRFGFLLLAVIGLLAACTTANPPPTYTPWSTYTPYPTDAPASTPTLPPPPTPATTEQVGVIVNEPAAAPGYTLFSRSPGNAYYLIDLQGRVVQQWQLGEGQSRFARLRENGNLLAMGYGNRYNDGVRELNPQGELVWQYRLPGQHHDFLPLPNGNILLIRVKIKSAAEAIALGADPKYVSYRGVSGTWLVEVKPTLPEGGEIGWEWSVWDHIIQDFDPEKPNYGVVADHPELVDLNYRPAPAVELAHRTWMHANSVAYHPELDQIMLSVRHFSELWIIDRSTTTAEAASHRGGRSGQGGDLLYRWGNPRAWQAGTAADQQFFFQHDAHWIPPGLPGAGNVLVFNNGHEFEGFERGYSSLDELVLPREGYNYRRSPGLPYEPTQPEWTFTSPNDFYSPIFGSLQRLPNGNTLFSHGKLGIIWEITPAGRTVWKYISPVLEGGRVRQGDLLTSYNPRNLRTGFGNEVYRAYRYSPGFPGLSHLDLTPGEVLELPANP